MNLGRDPRWGRFQESISEDPYLNVRQLPHYFGAISQLHVPPHAPCDMFVLAPMLVGYLGLQGMYSSLFVQAFQGSSTFGKPDYGPVLGVAATCRASPLTHLTTLLHHHNNTTPPSDTPATYRAASACAVPHTC